MADEVKEWDGKEPIRISDVSLTVCRHGPGSLLAKYMRYVLDVEGTTFVGERGEASDVVFTAEDLEELRRMGNVVRGRVGPG